MKYMRWTCVKCKSVTTHYGENGNEHCIRCRYRDKKVLEQLEREIRAIEQYNINFN
jgi:hypothetical protein